MTFGEALEKMEAGAFVARRGWNGKKQFIYMVEGSVPTLQKLRGRAKAAAIYFDKCADLLHDKETGETIAPIQPHIDMFTEQRTIVCGWLASQTDMTATDWYVRDYAQNQKGCKDCANSIDEKICTGDKEHGWVDTTGEKKCFAPKEPDPEPAEQMPDLVVPGLRTCWNCKHGTQEQTGPGQIHYGCDSKMQCYDHSEWEAGDGTQSN